MVAILTILLSCNSHFSNQGNTFLSRCRVNAGPTQKKPGHDFSLFQEFRDKITTKYNLPSGLHEILLAEETDGGDGNHDFRIIFFDDDLIIPVIAKYEIENKNITSIDLKTLCRRKHRKLSKAFFRTQNISEWFVYVNCFSATIEERRTFYIKDGNRYLYYSEFENFDTGLHPTIGINRDILAMIKILESL